MQFLRFNVSNLRWALVAILVSSVNVNGKPTMNLHNPIDGFDLLDPAKYLCTNKTINLCQRCAKKTKGDYVYPWCCANYEGTRQWCEQYLDFGLP